MAIDLAEITFTESRILAMETEDMIRTIGTTDVEVLRSRGCSRSFIECYVAAVEEYQRKQDERRAIFEEGREKRNKERQRAVEEARKRLGWAPGKGEQ